MVHYPEVMRRAQAQIDTVVGRDRLPTFGDRDRLPYIEAIIKEVQRWRPVGPIGLPRCTTQVRRLGSRYRVLVSFPMKDDWYKGYFIPKGKHCPHVPLEDILIYL